MMGRDGLLLPLYRTGTALLRPLAEPLLRRRERRGKEDGARLGERMGQPGMARPDGPLVWLHGASVGEGLALLPLVDRLIGRGLTVLVTTGTVSSAAILEERLPEGAIHQFLPLDIPSFMRGFLDHWRPSLALLAESELWPNLIAEVANRQIPLALVNARLSARSFARWRRLRGLAKAMLSRAGLCLAQTAEDATRFTALGAPRVVVAGNLKYDVPPPPADREAVAELGARIGSRPVWVAASTHVEEEEIILGVHGRLARRFTDLLTIIVPRQVERGPGIAQAAEALGLRARLRSQNQPIDDAQVYVADTMGEIGLFYRVTGVVFVGKSMAGGGGQNPIEPAKLGCAVLHGPLVSNFAEVYRLLDEAEGAATMDNPKVLADTLTVLFAEAPKLRRMARNAAETIEHLGGATDRTLRALDPVLRRALHAET